MEMLSLLGAVAIIFAALAYGIERAFDILGWSRSSKLLRQENEDLVRRNDDLDGQVRGLQSQIATLNQELDVLRARVSELSKTDMSSVLLAIASHEAAAADRSREYLLAMHEIRDAVRLVTERS